MSLPEVWMRGEIPGYPKLLQPIVHVLLQQQEEMTLLMQDFPNALLWAKPAGMANVAFHIQHISGVLDRMATYARAEKLNDLQFDYLKNEGVRNGDITVSILLDRYNGQVAKFLGQIAQTDETALTEFRGVGRKMLPSTLGGLLFHAVEHTQRHYGQLLVTVRLLKSESID